MVAYITGVEGAHVPRDFFNKYYGLGWVYILVIMTETRKNISLGQREEPSHAETPFKPQNVFSIYCTCFFVSYSISPPSLQL